MKYMIISGLFAMSGTTISTAAPEGGRDCNEPETTADMVICLGRDYAAADHQLNQVYQKEMAALDGLGKRLLRDAQRKWIGFRDAECERVRDVVRGGTLASVLGSSCMLELTEARVKQLRGSGESSLAEPSEKVFWHSNKLTAKFNGKDMQYAELGLLPEFDYKNNRQMLKARLRLGEQLIDFPIGGDAQNAFCSAAIEMLPSSNNGGMAIRLDDGMCDAIFVRWDAASNAYLWERN